MKVLLAFAAVLVLADTAKRGSNHDPLHLAPTTVCEEVRRSTAAAPSSAAAAAAVSAEADDGACSLTMLQVKQAAVGKHKSAGRQAAKAAPAKAKHGLATAAKAIHRAKELPAEARHPPSKLAPPHAAPGAWPAKAGVAMLERHSVTTAMASTGTTTLQPTKQGQSRPSQPGANASQEPRSLAPARRASASHSESNLLLVLAISILSLAAILFVIFEVYMFIRETEDENDDGKVDLTDMRLHLWRVCFGTLSNEGVEALVRVLVISAAGFYVLWGMGVVQPVIAQLCVLGYIAFMFLTVAAACIQYAFADVMQVQERLKQGSKIILEHSGLPKETLDKLLHPGKTATSGSAPS